MCQMQHSMSGLVLVFETPAKEVSEYERIMVDDPDDIMSVLSYSQSDFGLPDRWAPASPAKPDSADKPQHQPIHATTTTTTTIKSDQTPRIPRRPSQDEATMSSYIIKMDRSPQMPQRRCGTSAA